MSNSDEPKDNFEENQKALEVTLSIQWLEDGPLDKMKFNLETTLQTWASARGRLTCQLLDVSADGRVVQVSLKPPPDLSELVALKGQTLSRKNEKVLIVTNVNWDGDGAQVPQDGVSKAPPSPPSEQHERAPVNGEGRAGPPGAVFMSGNEYFEMFMDPRGREALGLIEKRNNCVMKAEVRVEFVKGEGEGDPQKALSEFTALMQRWVRPPHSSVVPPGCPDPEELDTQGGMDKPEDVQLTQSSLDQREPSQSKDTMEVSSGGPLWVDVLEASSWTSQPTTAEVKMDINDPFCSGGITIEKSCWTLMTTSYSEDLLKVQQKFGVRFEAEHNVQQDKVRMRAAGGRNAALESHAVRALSHLYTRIVTSPFTSQQPGGATGFTEPDPPKNAPKRDHGEPLLSGQSGGNTVTKKAMVEAAAGGGDLTEDNCPICLDTFKEKRQLGCKHQFCSGCLEASINSMGPCCPVCKQVFGTIVGNQPRGRMTSFMNHKSLPGFPNCGTIVINYEIRAGIQTEKHPNPGKRFHGVQRKAYLPNNEEGREVLRLLQKAFDQKLVFTVGVSRTTMADNQVTWNDIHHKTSTTGGPTNFGYPDPDYLRRVRDELKAKGIE